MPKLVPLLKSRCRSHWVRLKLGAPYGSQHGTPISDTHKAGSSKMPEARVQNRPVTSTKYSAESAIYGKVALCSTPCAFAPEDTKRKTTPVGVAKAATAKRDIRVRHGVPRVMFCSRAQISFVTYKASASMRDSSACLHCKIIVTAVWELEPPCELTVM